MNQDSTPPVTNIVLEIDPRLSTLSNGLNQINRDINKQVIEKLKELQENLGIPGDVTFVIKINGEIYSNVGRRAHFFHVYVNKARCRFPIELIQQLYGYILGSQSKKNATLDEIFEWILNILKKPTDYSNSLITEFVTLVCLESVKNSPSLLLGPYHVAWIHSQLNKRGFEFPDNLEEVVEPSQTSIQQILSKILDLKFSISGCWPFFNSPEWSKSNFINSSDEMTEKLIAFLNKNLPKEIEIHISKEYLQELTQDLVTFEEYFVFLREGLFFELGMRYPNIRFVIKDMDRHNCFQFKINDILTPPILGLSPSEIFVHKTLAKLKQIFQDELLSQNQTSVNEFSIISINDLDQIKNKNVSHWDPFGYLVLQLSFALRRFAYCFLDLNEVTEKVSEISKDYPFTVGMFSEEFSIEKTTKILRSLISENVSLINLRLILERLLEFEVVIVDSPKNKVFDGRLPVLKGVENDLSKNTDHFVSFIRMGMSDQINLNLTKTKVEAKFFRLDSTHDQLLVEKMINQESLKEKELNTIHDDIYTNINSLDPSIQSVLVTNSYIRTHLRKLTFKEFPDLHVLSELEISPEIDMN